MDQCRITVGINEWRNTKLHRTRWVGGTSHALKLKSILLYFYVLSTFHVYNVHVKLTQTSDAEFILFCSSEIKPVRAATKHRKTFSSSCVHLASPWQRVHTLKAESYFRELPPVEATPPPVGDAATLMLFFRTRCCVQICFLHKLQQEDRNL